MSEALTMITQHHNYDYGYITLANLGLGDLPETVHVAGYELTRKSEFHISLLSIKRLSPLIDADNQERVGQELVDMFLDFSSKNDLVSYSVLPVFRFVERDDKKTLIVMTEVTALSGLFETIRQKYKIDIPDQPTHVTLYTLQPEAGIGLLSQESVELESTVVDVPELSSLL